MKQHLVLLSSVCNREKPDLWSIHKPTLTNWNLLVSDEVPTSRETPLLAECLLTPPASVVERSNPGPEYLKTVDLDNSTKKKHIQDGKSATVTYSLLLVNSRAYGIH